MDHLVSSSDKGADVFNVISVDRIAVHDNGPMPQVVESRIVGPIPLGLRNHLDPVGRLTFGSHRLPDVFSRRLQADVENAVLGIRVARCASVERARDQRVPFPDLRDNSRSDSLFHHVGNCICPRTT